MGVRPSGGSSSVVVVCHCGWGARASAGPARQVTVADQATDDLNTGRRLVVAALAFLLIGVGVSWWAPSVPTDPPAYLKVTYSNTSACGALRSADGRQIRLTVTGNHDPITVPLAQITNLTVVSTCD